MPTAIDAERMILGSLLVGNAVFDEIAASLRWADFSIERHQRIYLRIADLFERGDVINRITVFEELTKAGQGDAGDWLGYLVDLEGESVPVNLDSYIRLVRDKALLRQTIAACQTVVGRCMTGDTAIDVIEQAEAVLSKLGDSAEQRVKLKTPLEIKATCPGGVSGFLQPKTQRVGIESPWPSLNQLIPVFRAGQLILIAARPGRGKSVAASQIAVHAAQRGKGVALFSLEMSAGEILARMTCARAGVDNFRYQEGAMGRDERERFLRASVEIDQFPGLWIDDSTGCTVPAIHGAVRRQRASASVDLVIIDYLQLMAAPGRLENRVQEISSISRGLKLMARDFQVPVIALSQLSRASVQDDGPPELHHLRDSGSLEQDADTVIMQYTARDADGPVTETKFYVRKQRGGPTGVKTLTFNKPFSRFEDRDEERRPVQPMLAPPDRDGDDDAPG
jgi:replicative DNA helicase